MGGRRMHKVRSMQKLEELFGNGAQTVDDACNAGGRKQLEDLFTAGASSAPQDDVQVIRPTRHYAIDEEEPLSLGDAFMRVTSAPLVGCRRSTSMVETLR